MGLIHANVRLSNPRNGNAKSIEVRAPVDTGAMTLCVPEHVAVQLNLQETERREVTIADDRRIVVSYVGPVQINFENRTCFTGALVLGESVLMGAIPLEDMDLVVHPQRRTIVVNPDSPNIPSAIVKLIHCHARSCQSPS